MKNKKIACLAVAGVLALSGGSYYAGMKSAENTLTSSADSISTGTYEFLSYEVWQEDLNNDGVDDECIKIKDCSQNANGDIIVPDYIDGLPVVELLFTSTISVYDGVFRDCDMITSVTLPKRIKSIPWYTFYNCESLKSVSMADDVSSIESNAFAYCTSLESITIKDKYCSIDNNAFDGISTDTVFYGYENSTLEGFCQRKGFTFEVIDDENVVKEPQVGDVNADGWVDASDASMILAYYAYASTTKDGLAYDFNTWQKEKNT